MRAYLTFLCLFINALFSVVALADGTKKSQQYCNPVVPKSTPNHVFVIQDNPAWVLHKTTGLIWQRCLVGQTFKDGKCEGEPQDFILKPRPKPGEPMDEGSVKYLEGLTKVLDENKGWRAPNQKERLSIIELACVAPALNTEIFPGYKKPVSTRVLVLPRSVTGIHSDKWYKKAHFYSLYFRLVKESP